MQKDFDKWNEKKKVLNGIAPKAFPKEREVWICSCGLNIGYEQNGNNQDFERPVLIFKKFNNQMAWGIPLSTKQKPLDFYYNFVDPNGNKVSAIIAQMKLFSVKRFDRKMYILPDYTFQEVKYQLLRLL